MEQENAVLNEETVEAEVFGNGIDLSLTFYCTLWYIVILSLL